MVKSGKEKRLLIWLTVVILLLTYVFTSVHVVSDLKQFMPADKQDSRFQILNNELMNGPAATTLLASIQGGEINELLRLSKTLFEKLSKDHSLIHSVNNGQVAVSLQGIEELQVHRYLLSDQNWTKEGLQEKLEKRLSELYAGSPVANKYITSDPLFALDEYLSKMINRPEPKKINGIWFDESMGALLTIKVKGESLDLDVMEAALSFIYSSFNSIEPEQGVKLNIAGPGVMAVESRSGIKTTTQNLTWVLIVVLLFIFYFAYRSLALVLLVSIPLLSAILAGITATQLVFNEVHGIVIAFGVTLLGVCLDYPLHLFSHSRGTETSQATLSRIWPTLRLGGISSIVAYLVLLGSGFDGLSQLAVFAAFGLSFALWVTHSFLPFWVNPTRIQPRYIPLKHDMSKCMRTMIVIALMLLPVWAWLSVDTVWEASIDALSPVPAQAKQLDGDLRKAMAVPEIAHVFVVESDQKEDVLVKTEKLLEQLQELKQNQIVENIIAITQVLPSTTKQKQRQLKIPAMEELKINFNSAIENSPFRVQAFEPFFEEVNAARNQSYISEDVLAQTSLRTILQQSLVKTDSGWFSIVRLQGVSSEKEIMAWLDDNAELKPYHLQLKQAANSLLESYRDATVKRISIALLVLVILIWFGMKNFWNTMRIMAPVGLGVFSALMAPLILEQGLTVFHLLAALLVIGMGLDYSLFFNRKETLEGESIQSFHAISVSMLTTAIVFSVLAISSIPVLSAMGIVIMTGVIQCFILAWMFSPRLCTR